MTSPPHVRVRLRILGRVQGVGYRAGALREALRLGLSGWVRNLPDGSVEALAEGPEAAAEAFRAWCARGPRLAEVLRVEAREEPAGERLGRFSVRD